MVHPLRVRRLAMVVATGLVLAVSGCGSGGVTAVPLQDSIGSAFANLYVRQRTEKGDPGPDPAALHARAACRKGTQADPQRGAGDWACQITFLVAGPDTPVTALYAVTVQTDGCYAADGDGPASVNGFVTVSGPGGRPRVNPLRLIDGCFELS